MNNSKQRVSEDKSDKKEKKMKKFVELEDLDHGPPIPKEIWDEWTEICR